MTRSHSRLTPTQRALLRSRHGLTVCREVEGVAYCMSRTGRVQYSVEHLKSLLRPTLRERFVHWIAGVSV